MSTPFRPPPPPVPAPDLAAPNFPTAEDEAAQGKPTALYDGEDSSYQLAFTDERFLLREELRPVRMQLELLKPELVLSEENVLATIVLVLLPHPCRRWPRIRQPRARTHSAPARRPVPAARIRGGCRGH